MDLHLTGKVIIVTGGAKGIGEAVVRLLAAEGAIPVIIDKDEAAGQILVAGIPSRTLLLSADLNSPESCQHMVDQVASQFGKIDGLVNNAGTNDGIGLEKGTPSKFRESLINNAAHYYSMAHFSLPYLKKSKGSIVNISSKTALTGQGNTSGYAGAKGAILAFTREWAVELLPYQIRVNAIVPAEVWTPMYASWVQSFPKPEEKLKSINARIPLENRMTTPQEIANMTVFLLSDRSSHMTGQWLHVDGGYVHLDRAIQ
jgi:NAD(P)-dependent dehydrogenase (short-subunit alcohol dehydrogenase family)